MSLEVFNDYRNSKSIKEDSLVRESLAKTNLHPKDEILFLYLLSPQSWLTPIHLPRQREACADFSTFKRRKPTNN